jgi:two-component system, NtrC family, sensor kinase
MTTEAPSVQPPPAVLIVDDVEANLTALEALLEDMDCRVVRARSGNDALRLLLRQDFAVMLLDVQMPGMDGYEVAHHARHNPSSRDVPILFLTAATRTDQNVLKGYGSGAVDFLHKPVEPEILRSKVRVFLDLYRGRRQIADSKAALEVAYKELQSTQAQLIQSAKMASLGQLVAGVAHEINNPLAFCISHLNTARRGLDGLHTELGELPPGAQELWSRTQNRLEEMDRGLGRVKELVLKLRTFSRLDEGEFKNVSVEESIDSVMTILGHRMRGRIEVQLSLLGPPRIECYPSLLNQAVMNLAANSIDAMPDGGTLSISTGVEGDDYVIRVTDTGEGIPEAIRDRIFEPFFTTKEVGEGTGLGLAITYSIVHKHGGTLDLRPTQPRGTEAQIRIPSARLQLGSHAG